MARSSFLATLLLAIILVAAKFALLWQQIEAPSDWVKLFAVTAEDVAAAMVFGALAAGFLWASRRKPGAQRWVRAGILLIGAVASLYAVASVAIFHSMGVPLNVRMFGLVGRFAHMRSSMVEHCNLWIATGMVLAPAGYALGVALGSRRQWLRTPPRIIVGVLGALACAWVAGGLALRAHADPDTWVRRASVSPHYAMLRSLAAQLMGQRPPDLKTQFPAEYLEDFRPAAEVRRPPSPQFSPPPRNVILIVLESTTAQYMSLYGSPYDTTPNLLRESRNALIFDRFYAHVGFTFCSRIPLLYASYPGLPWLYWYGAKVRMTPGIGKPFKEKGYRTAFFSASDPDWDALRYVANDAGLDEVFGPEELGGRIASSWGTEDGAMVDGLIRWIDADQGKERRPFYAVAWTDQTHDPYTLAADTQPLDLLGDARNSARMRHAQSLNRYLNAVRQADRHLGRLFDALRARHLADDTLVVITGDHGEAFGEWHDVMAHGGGLFEENLRVPMMLWNPRLFPTPQRSDRVGGHVDINPTLAHIMGIDPPAGWQGVSLFSDDHPGRAYLLVDFGGYQFGIADSRFKYIFHVADGFERLYDMRADPGEKYDVSAQYPQLMAEYRARISAFLTAEEQYLTGQKGGR